MLQISSLKKIQSDIRSGRLKRKLSRIVGAWDRFRDDDIKYFRDENVLSNDAQLIQKCLYSISRKYVGLRGMFKELEGLEESLGRIDVGLSPAIQETLTNQKLGRSSRINASCCIICEG